MHGAIAEAGIQPLVIPGQFGIHILLNIFWQKRIPFVKESRTRCAPANAAPELKDSGNL
jgi:hypothetical protein